MPQVQLIPPPTVEYEQDIIWPNMRTGYGVGTAFQTEATMKNNLGAAFALFGAAVGAGSNIMTLRDNVQVGRFAELAAAGVTRFTTGITMPIALTTASLPTGFVLPSALRVFRISWLMALTGNLDNLSGFHLNSAAAGTPGFQNFYVGVQGDGAGGWEYESNQSAGGAPSETVALGAAQGITTPTELNAFELEVQAATPTADAQLRLFIGGIPRITRSWGPGSLLPDYGASGPANAMRFTVSVQMNTVPAGGQVDIGGLRFRFGRFTADGLEVTG